MRRADDTFRVERGQPIPWHYRVFRCTNPRQVKRGSFSSGRNLCKLVSFVVRLLQPPTIYLWPLIFGTRTFRSYTTTISMAQTRCVFTSLPPCSMAGDRPRNRRIKRVIWRLKIRYVTTGTHLPTDTGTNSRCINVLLKRSLEHSRTPHIHFNPKFPTGGATNHFISLDYSGCGICMAPPFVAGHRPQSLFP